MSIVCDVSTLFESSSSRHPIMYDAIITLHMNVIIASYMIGCLLDEDSNRVETSYAIDVFC